MSRIGPHAQESTEPRLAEIVITTDGGPWAKHNMPCAVCRQRHAVLDLSCGVMGPCWECQSDGWQIKRKWGIKRLFAKLMGWEVKR